MAKKFDVVIGNPPYQEDSVGDSTHNMPIYDKFMEAAYEVAEKVVLITPARFLFNAGYTPKAWNAKMLADPHLSVPIYVRNSTDLFPGTKIRAGVAVTYRDAGRKALPRPRPWRTSRMRSASIARNWATITNLHAAASGPDPET